MLAPVTVKSLRNVPSQRAEEISDPADLLSLVWFLLNGSNAHCGPPHALTPISSGQSKCFSLKIRFKMGLSCSAPMRKRFQWWLWGMSLVPESRKGSNKMMPYITWLTFAHPAPTSWSLENSGCNRKDHESSYIVTPKRMEPQMLILLRK